jgi:hypothetical protein
VINRIKKYYVITNDDKKVCFGAAGMSDFTIHKDEARKQIELVYPADMK